LLHRDRTAAQGVAADRPEADCEGQFPEIAESQPELLARHCTEAALIEKAAGLWGKAGQRSLERSALVEAMAQLTRALDQIATLPATPARRREQIKLQVALINPLIHVKGPAAPETKTAAERARLLIEQAEALGEPPEDPRFVLRPLRLLRRKPRIVQWRCDARACSAIPNARRETHGDGRASGWVVAAYRLHRRRTSCVSFTCVATSRVASSRQFLVICR